MYTITEYFLSGGGISRDGILYLQGIGLFSALRSVSSHNPVSCILWLIMVFVSFSSVIIYLGCEFLGLVFLVVYVGAIAVLFLFVVMMLNVRVTELNSKFLSYFPISSILVSILVILLSTSIYEPLSGFGFFEVESFLSLRMTNIEDIGNILYTSHALVLFISGAILLLAMVGSIMLTLHKKSTTKRQLVSDQLSHDFHSQLTYKQ